MIKAPIRKFFIAMLLVCTAPAFCSSTPAFAQAPVTLRVMTMNICLGGERGGYIADDYAALINRYRPDVVCLQEVDYKTIRNGGRDWLNDLALATGMMPAFYPSFPMDTGAYGTALLSRYPFYRSYHSVYPPANGEKEPRAAGWIYLQLPEKVSVRVMTVHFALKTEENTIGNMDFIGREFFGQGDSLPAVMAGDFNAVAGSAPIRYVEREWDEMAPESGSTFPAGQPDRQLDFVMTYPKGAWTCAKFEIIDRPDLSDHCFVVADLDLRIE